MNSQQHTQITEELIIQTALRTSGFLFPETVEEVKEDEKIYGNTDAILPRKLEPASFLEKVFSKEARVVSIEFETFAMAARANDNEPLSDDILRKMEEDRKNYETKRKIKKY